MAAISVIVPIYKVEAFLHRCVDSILAQTFADFDLVLVDDGSPDSCGDICEEYARKDGRIHVIHQKNGGLSAARNTGIDWAQANSGSQWLAFVDSDDWVHPDFLRRLYTMVQKRGACSVPAAISAPGAGISRLWVRRNTAFCRRMTITAPTRPGKMYRRSHGTSCTIRACLTPCAIP